MPFHHIFSKNRETYETKPTTRPKIIVDHREKNSLIVSELMRIGCEVDLKQLQIGDYIIKNTVVERKTINDFLGSMINKRLRKQLINMQQCKSKLLIVEGIDECELYHSDSTIHENAVRGFLLSIALHYQVPMIFTKDYADTAQFLKILANKSTKERDNGINDKPKARNKNEQLQFIIEGFPGIGPKTAKKLLKEFNTIENIIKTPLEKLTELIGKKAEIFKIIKDEYK